MRNMIQNRLKELIILLKNTAVLAFLITLTDEGVYTRQGL